MLCGDSFEMGDALSGGEVEARRGDSERRKSPLRMRSFVIVSLKNQQRSDLFVSSSAWIVLSADIDVLDDLAVTFVSIVVEAEA